MTDHSLLAPDSEVHDLRGPPDDGRAYALAVGSLAVLLLVGFVPGIAPSYWAVRAALLLVVVVPGAVVLAVDATRKDAAALAGAAVIGWSGISALLSSQPSESILGGFRLDKGVLYTAGYLAVWALARRVSPEWRPLLGSILVGGGAVVALIGMAQVWLDLWDVVPGLGSRASGTLGNPVFFGTVCAATVVLAARLFAPSGGGRARDALLLGAVATCAAGLELSGTRIALAAGAVGLVGSLALRPSKRLALAAGVAVLAIVAGSFISGSAGASARVGLSAESGGATSGLTPRLESWQAAAESIAERPVFGWGPGGYRVATSPRLSAEFARTEGPDRIFYDAHNAIVEYATTIGIVGLGLVAGFLLLAGWRARGPLAAYAVTVGLTMALEPVSIVTAPLLLLALGAAGPRAPAPSTLPRAASAIAIGGAALGTLAGIAVVGSAWMAQNAADRGSSSQLDRAQSLFRADPLFADTRRDLALSGYLLTANPAALDDAREAAVEATRLQPDLFRWWVERARVELIAGDDESGLESLATALERYPWSRDALELTAKAARSTGDRRLFDSAVERLCQLGDPACSTLTFPLGDAPEGTSG